MARILFEWLVVSKDLILIISVVTSRDVRACDKYFWFDLPYLLYGLKFSFAFWDVICLRQLIFATSIYKSTVRYDLSSRIHKCVYSLKTLYEISALKLTLRYINPLNAELNPICHLLALLGAHHILHISRIKVNSLLLRYFPSVPIDDRLYSICA